MPISAKDRKAAQKAKEDEALSRLGGRRMKFIMYGQTLAILEAVCKAQGFTGRQRLAEGLTYLIHLKADIVSTHEKEKSS